MTRFRFQTVITLLFLYHFSSVNAQNWLPKGQVMRGDTAGMFFGSSVCLSADGNTLAVGAPRASSTGEYTGKVCVFSWIDGQWIQKGADINGDSIWDQVGTEIAMSKDGNSIIIGSNRNSTTYQFAGQVKVFHWANNKWSQRGNTFYGKRANDAYGLCVDLNKDGSIIAFSARDSAGLNASYAGKVEVYKWQDSLWELLGEPILGNRYNQYFGRQFEMNDDGNMLAIQSYPNDTIHTYEWVINHWRPTWNMLTGLYATGTKQINFSSDGHTMIIGYPSRDYDSSGTAKVYRFTAQRWIQIGKNLVNNKGLRYFGSSTSMSSDGQYVAVWSRNTVQSYLTTYVFNGLNYEHFGRTITDSFGSYGERPIAISGDGKTVCLGARTDSVGGSFSGSVQVFKYCENSYDSISETANCAFSSPSGKRFLESMIFNDTIPSQLGCDSVITINLTVNHPKLITFEPENVIAKTHDSIYFTLKSNATKFQWQLDTGEGFQNIFDSGNYSGSNTDSLKIQDLDLTQNNYVFRCLTEEGECSDTSETAWLVVTQNAVIENHLTEYLHIYPNPINRQLFIHSRSNEVNIERIRVFDQLGHKLFESNPRSRTETIDMETHSDGLYLISVKLSNGRTYRTSVVKSP